MSNQPHIQFDLLANARDSLRQAVELLALKELGLISSDHARLTRDYFWENVDKYPNLEARTVTVDTAISRLKNIGGVKFTDKDEKNLRSLRTKRQESLLAMLLVSRFLSLPSISAPIFRRTSSTTILGDHSLRSCLTSFALLAARIEAKLRAKGEYPSYCDVYEQ